MKQNQARRFTSRRSTLPTSSSSSSSSSSEWFKDRDFGIVLDAGSSGTRVQVYSWKSARSQLDHRLAHQQPTNVLPRVETGVQYGDDWQLKVEPGISSFGSHPHHVGQYLKPLLDHALKLIPSHQVSSTPFFLLATAGMRLLPQSQQDQILEQACSYVQKNYEFLIRDCSHHIRTISGEDEGTFGWIAVNYLMDGFEVHQPASSTSNPSSESFSTFGFLDMGGASTQIAFEPNRAQRIEHADNLTNLTFRLLDGTDISHSVFVTTWLGYGTNKARERYSKLLLDNFPDSTNDRKKPKKSGMISDPCLPASLLLPSPSSKFQFNGTGDFQQCIKNISPLLNKNAPCLDQPCLFDGKHVPPIDFSVNRFIGISEYWYSTQDLWSMGGIYDFVEFEKKAISYCQQNWDDIIQGHKSGNRWPSKVEISRLESQCFKAAWIINILHEGIGIPRIIDKGGQGDQNSYNQEGIKKAAEKGLIDSPPVFQSLNEVHNISVSWTLGKMVLEVSQQLPSHTSSNPTSTLPFDDLRGIHTPHLEGLKAQLSVAKSWIEPMALLGMAIAALGIWFLYFCSKSLCQSRKDRPSGQGYMLASMEEGDSGRRDPPPIGSRSSTPRLSRKPSLTSTRNFFSSGPSHLIHQTVSRALELWPLKANPTHRPISLSRPNSPRPNRPTRMASPNPTKLSRIGSPNPAKYLDNNVYRGGSGGGNVDIEDEDQKMIIPPVSITTSLLTPSGGAGFQSTASTRTSIDEGLFVTVPTSRTGSNSSCTNFNGKNSKRLNDERVAHHSPNHLELFLKPDPNHLHPERPKQRMVHSKSFHSLSSPTRSLDDHYQVDDFPLPSSYLRNHSSSSNDCTEIEIKELFKTNHPHQQSYQRNLNSNSCINLTDFDDHHS